METENTQNKLINFLKVNFKIFIYILVTLILIFASTIWFANSNKTKKTEISDSFIKAQILISFTYR